MRVTHRRSDSPLPTELLDDERLDKLAAWGQRLATLGLSPGSSGNLSCRSAHGFLITGTGVPLDAIERDDWVEVGGTSATDDGGLLVTSRGLREPSKDASVHAAIYASGAAEAVFHLHPEYLDRLTDDLGVPRTDTYYPAGTVESRREIERFLARHPDAGYFVLVDHGIVSWSATIDSAGEAVEDHHAAVDGLGS